MIDTKALRQKILDMAIRGELVSQNPNDEPASVLLEKIRAEKQRLIKEGKIKKDKVDSVIFKCDDNRHYENLPNGWVEISLFEICWLEDGNQINGEELVYWDAKALRGKNTKVKISYGKIVEQGKNVILVDGENSGEVFTIPYRGYLGSTFKILQIAPLVSQNFVRIILDYNRDLFRENKTGSAIPHLNKRLFKTMNVLLPPFLEQERIAKNVDLLLSQIDIIEQNQTGIETLYDELKKRTLDLAIQGKLVPQDENDEPASVLLEKIRAEKKAKLGKKYVDSNIYKGDDNCYYEHIDGIAEDKAIEIPFDLSNNWAWSRIQDISESYIGLTYKPSDIVQKNGSIVLRSSNIKYGKLDLTDIVRVNSSIAEKLYVKKNDIIICARNGSKKLVGKSAIVDVDIPNLTFGAFMAICKTLLYKYVYVFLQSNLFFSQLAGVSGTTTINQLTQASFNSFLIPIPPLAEQQRMVEKINEIFAKL